MEKFWFPIAFHPPEFLLRFPQARGRPTQGLLSFSPAFHVARHALDGREARLDGIGGGQCSAQQPAHTQPMHRQRFLQPFFQTACRAGVDAFQLPEDFLQLRFCRRVIPHRVAVTDSPVVIALDVLRQMFFHIAPLVNLAALHFGTLAEHSLDSRAQRFRSVDHEQVAPIGIEAARHQVFQQLLHHRGVFRRPLPQPQNMFFHAGFDAQHHHQHLFAEMTPVDQQGCQIQPIQFLLAQFLHLRRAGLHEFAAHAGFLDPVAVLPTLHGPAIVPRSQSRDDAFAHRALPPSVVLQPRVTVQFHFLAFPRAPPRTLHGHLPPAKHHVTRLVSPAHRAGHGIRPVRRSHAPRHLVFQNRADDAQPGFPGQLFHLGLQLLPHLDYRQRHLHHQLPLAHDLELRLGLVLPSLIAFPHSGSPLKKSFQPELYPSSGREPLLPLSRFQLKAGQLPISTADISTPGTVQVTVSNPTPGGGPSAPQSFTITQPTVVPTIASVSPASIPAGSPTTVTITGTGFIQGAAVYISGAVGYWGANVTSSTQLSLSTLSVPTPRTYPLYVLYPAPAGTSTAFMLPVTQPPAPTITSISPTTAPNSSSPTLTITGSGFEPGASVLFNSSNYAATFSSSTQLSVVLPLTGIAAGTYPIAVVDPAPAGTSNAVSFTVPGPPPDFSLNYAGATSATVAAGQTATFINAVYVFALNGFTGMANLSCSLPAAATQCSVSPSSVPPQQAATITVTTTARGLLPPLWPRMRYISRPQFLPVLLLAIVLSALLLRLAQTRRQRFAGALPL